jgi:penicillin-binding protein 1C
MHERVRIDRLDGLRAGPACAASEVEERVFERFPPDLLAWATAAGRPMAPTEWSSRCPGDPTAVAGESLRIAYPLDGARFVIDPESARDSQHLEVEVVAPSGAREVALVVDGKVTAHAGRPFALSWPLEPGDHQLVAVAGEASSPTVRIRVRDGASP